MITTLTNPVHVSLGTLTRMSHSRAIDQVMQRDVSDPLLGSISTAKLQLCPQNYGKLDEVYAAELRKQYPAVEWRLHANVQIEDSPRRVDLCDWLEAKAWFTQAARVSNALASPAYSAHAGHRAKATISQVISYTKEIEQVFGVPVGIEGHYPNKGNNWLFSDWQEYRALLDHGVHYVIDLSHLNIVAEQTGNIEHGLVQELLDCERCIEVHVSGNDGSADQHLPLSAENLPWWWSHLLAMKSTATLFSEGRIV